MAASTPPRIQTKSASRLSKLRHYSEEGGGPSSIPQLSLEIVPSSPRISSPSPSSTVSPRPPYTLPLKDLLMLSLSPAKRSKARLEMADDAAIIESSGVRKRCKTRNSGSTCAVASPRGGRRSRRRLEQDVMREDKEVAAGGEVMVKPRKKRHSERSKAAAKSSAPTPSVPSPRTADRDGYNLDAIGEVIHDLIMWKDVSKSSLWFGLGTISFLSSSFVKGVNFSILSLLCQVGLLFLGISFFSNSICKRDAMENKPELKLKEDDILRFSRLILPAVNLAIAKTRQLFSGEPAMTLKVVPIFLAGAEYGHFITLWRLSTLGFFISFTCPRLYSAYSSQLSKKVDCVKSWARDAWVNCTHKKVVAASAVAAFWNLTSIRTRVFAAFLCLVILRYHRQRCSESDATMVEEEDAAAEIIKQEEEQKQPENALAVVALVE